MTSLFVKVCGITTEEDALLAVAMDADALGFVFAPSQRQVRPQVVADIVKRLPPEILTVGVFKDELPERVISIVRSTGLKAAQIHGSFTTEGATAVRRALFHTIVAFAAGDPRVPDAEAYEPYAVHLDSARPGSGKVFDWTLVSQVPAGLRLIVAGGLDPDNVGDVIRATRPWGVDVSTGVEASPGRKDPVKLHTFIANAREAQRAAAPMAATTAPAAQPGQAPEEPTPYDWQQDGI
jgi:phosphoribosylanthranilate isomerase